MTSILQTYGKALTASLGALVAGLGVAMQDGDLTTKEGVASVGAALVFGFGAWAAPYKKSTWT